MFPLIIKNKKCIFKKTYRRISRWRGCKFSNLIIAALFIILNLSKNVIIVENKQAFTFGFENWRKLHIFNKVQFWSLLFIFNNQYHFLYKRELIWKFHVKIKEYVCLIVNFLSIGKLFFKYFLVKFISHYKFFFYLII